MADYVYFDPEVQLLLEELCNHPTLQLALTSHPTLEERLAAIATHLNLVIDGHFELNALCALLTKELYQSRTSIILNH